MGAHGEVPAVPGPPAEAYTTQAAPEGPQANPQANRGLRHEPR